MESQASLLVIIAMSILLVTQMHNRMVRSFLQLAPVDDAVYLCLLILLLAQLNETNI